MKKHITSPSICKTAGITHGQLVHIIGLIIAKFPQSIKEFKVQGDIIFVSSKGLDLIIDFYCKVTKIYELMDLALELEND